MSFDIVWQVIKSAGRSNSKVFFWIAESVGDAAAVNPKDAKTHLAIIVITLPYVNGKAVFSNGQRSLSRNYPNCDILDS